MQLAIQLIFAQVGTQLGIDEVLDNGVATSQSIAEGWNNQWNDLLVNNTSENLYGALTNLGNFFCGRNPVIFYDTIPQRLNILRI